MPQLHQNQVELQRHQHESRSGEEGARLHEDLVGGRDHIQALLAEAAGLGGISIFSYNSVPGGGGNLLRLNHARWLRILVVLVALAALVVRVWEKR